jgi:alkylation response protein AidB-like acyl-CoA dehydrogenase
VRALTDRAGNSMVAALAREALTQDERGEVAMHIAAAKVAATRMGLNLACQMFEVTGARATHAGLRLDRHWRNLRTHTLHDPVDYKLKELGEWALIRNYPTPTFYS